MPVTTLHLSSENSVRTSSGHHELRLEPGLQIPHDAKPTCYLHDLSFTNTIVNVSKSLYNNASVHVANGAATAVFDMPEGAYSLAEAEKELTRAIKRAAPTLFTTKLPDLLDADLADVETGEWNDALSIRAIKAGLDTGAATALTGEKVKLITLEPDAVVNRVRVYSFLTVTDGQPNTFFSDFLGMTQRGTLQDAVASNTARVDRARAVSVNVPSIVSGVYSSTGRLGGSQLALVPITVDIGRPQAFTASVPIKLRAKLAGTVLDRVAFHLASEDGDRIELQGERFDAIVVIEW